MKYSLVLTICCTVAPTVSAAPIHIISSAIATGSIPGANNAMGGAPPADGMSTWDRIAVLKDIPLNLGGLGNVVKPCKNDKRNVLEKRRRRGGSSGRSNGLGSRIGSLFRSSKHKSSSPSLDSSTPSSSLSSSTSGKASSGGLFSKFFGSSRTQPTMVVPMAMESQRLADERRRKKSRDRQLRRAGRRVMRKFSNEHEEEEKEEGELTEEEKKKLEEEKKKQGQKGQKGKKNSKRSIQLPITVSEDKPSSRLFKTLPVEKPVTEDI